MNAYACFYQHHLQGVVAEEHFPRLLTPPSQTPSGSAIHQGPTVLYQLPERPGRRGVWEANALFIPHGMTP